MRVSKLTCAECELGVEGEFHTPRLSRLSGEEQEFVELFVLASGSLKATAQRLGISYPTVRTRLDRLINRVQEQRTQDEQRKQRVLEAIEAGRISPKKGLRMIDALD